MEAAGGLLVAAVKRAAGRGGGGEPGEDEAPRRRGAVRRGGRGRADGGREAAARVGPSFSPAQAAHTSPPPGPASGRPAGRRHRAAGASLPDTHTHTSPDRRHGRVKRAAVSGFMDRGIQADGQERSFAGEVAVSIWEAGISKGCHEVFRTLGEPEAVHPFGEGSL